MVGGSMLGYTICLLAVPLVDLQQYCTSPIMANFNEVFGLLLHILMFRMEHGFRT